jgi:hypothetical protein
MSNTTGMTERTIRRRMYLSEEQATRNYIETEDRQSLTALESIDLDRLVEVRGICIGAEHEVAVSIPSQKFPYFKKFYFDSYSSAHSYIKALYPDREWETTGW